MSSHGAHVENSIWMRAVLMGITFLIVGVVAYGALGVIMADSAHHHVEEAAAEYEAAKEVYHARIADGNSLAGDETDPYYIAMQEAHHHEVEAELSYLNWKVPGVTILVMCLIYAAFIGLGGFVNSVMPDEDHSNGHDEHEHHGSASPIIFSLGILIFFMGFPEFVNVCKAMLTSGVSADLTGAALSSVGLLIIVLGVANWWREDLPFDGHGEQIASSSPFKNEHIRKAGLWVFIMSEIMVFASFFSSYLRMRTEWCTKWAFDEGKCSSVDVMTASDYLRPGGAAGTGDFWTMLPGGIKTFALIISSYTIVIALKTAKAHDWKQPDNVFAKMLPAPVMNMVFPDQKRTVRNMLFATFLLGSLFIVLKLIEWSHLVAEGFDIGSTAGSIFYVATGAHGLHVFIGLLVMLYLVFKADTVGFDEDNAQGIEYFGLYWHFVDLAWVAIFPAFYLY